MNQSDKIREFVYKNFVAPVRARGGTQVEVMAGDVHRQMGLVSAMPHVCSALGANKFLDEYGLRRISRGGPANGARATFVFGFTKEHLDRPRG
jgi:5-methylcytosine-specific restriction protein B